MKALFWHDWQVCKNRGIFWAVMIGNLVLAIAITSYAAGTAQSNGFSPQQVHAITASLMAIWAPLFAYEPAAEAGSLALGNSGWSFEESAQRYSERAFRESGRPMAEYLLSRMLFALIPLAVSMMLLIGYLLALRRTRLDRPRLAAPVDRLRLGGRGQLLHHPDRDGDHEHEPAQPRRDGVPDLYTHGTADWRQHRHDGMGLAAMVAIHRDAGRRGRLVRDRAHRDRPALRGDATGGVGDCHTVPLHSKRQLSPQTVQTRRCIVAQSKLDEVVSLAKRRGFVFPAGEIYGGTRSAWDYGPSASLSKTISSANGGAPWSSPVLMSSVSTLPSSCLPKCGWPPAT